MRDLKELINFNLFNCLFTIKINWGKGERLIVYAGNNTPNGSVCNNFHFIARCCPLFTALAKAWRKIIFFFKH